MIQNLIEDLRESGYNPKLAYLFGSYSKYKQKQHSDIDVAIWDDKFTGCLPIDYEKITSILRKYKQIELHTFNTEETEKDNPFIGEIKKTGAFIPIP